MFAEEVFDDPEEPSLLRTDREILRNVFRAEREMPQAAVEERIASGVQIGDVFAAEERPQGGTPCSDIFEQALVGDDERRQTAGTLEGRPQVAFPKSERQGFVDAVSGREGPPDLEWVAMDKDDPRRRAQFFKPKRKEKRVPRILPCPALAGMNGLE
jgi:hypothetical protein